MVLGRKAAQLADGAEQVIGAGGGGFAALVAHLLAGGGPGEGAIAQEVREKYPQAVVEKDGFLMVYYGVLDALIAEKKAA